MTLKVAIAGGGIGGLSAALAVLRVTRADGTIEEVVVTLRVDTPIEVDYYQNGGILPYVLRQLLAA